MALFQRQCLIESRTYAYNRSHGSGRIEAVATHVNSNTSIPRMYSAARLYQCFNYVALYEAHEGGRDSYLDDYVRHKYTVVKWKVERICGLTDIFGS